MQFKTLINNPADWMQGSGPHSDVVMTSRVRLARNLRRDNIARLDDADNVVAIFARHRQAGVQRIHECIAHLEHLVRRGRAVRETDAEGTHRYLAICRQAPTVSDGTIAS